MIEWRWHEWIKRGCVVIEMVARLQGPGEEGRHDVVEDLVVSELHGSIGMVEGSAVGRDGGSEEKGQSAEEDDERREHVSSVDLEVAGVGLWTGPCRRRSHGGAREDTWRQGRGREGSA
jgi:hypothetical protein